MTNTKKMLTQASHASLQTISCPKDAYHHLDHSPQDWESPRHVPRWLEARARTIRRICPGGCGASGPTRRWRSRSSEPESRRCHSTSSHPPAGSTAPYLGQVQSDIRAVIQMWLDQSRYKNVLKLSLSKLCGLISPEFLDHIWPH